MNIGKIAIVNIFITFVVQVLCRLIGSDVNYLVVYVLFLIFEIATIKIIDDAPQANRDEFKDSNFIELLSSETIKEALEKAKSDVENELRCMEIFGNSKSTFIVARFLKDKSDSDTYYYNVLSDAFINMDRTKKGIFIEMFIYEINKMIKKMPLLGNCIYEVNPDESSEFFDVVVTLKR